MEFLDRTPTARVERAAKIVREQRADASIGESRIVSGPFVDTGLDYADGDDYREAVFELERLQRAVMGET